MCVRVELWSIVFCKVPYMSSYVTALWWLHLTLQLAVIVFILLLIFYTLFSNSVVSCEIDTDFMVSDYNFSPYFFFSTRWRHHPVPQRTKYMTSLSCDQLYFRRRGNIISAAMDVSPSSSVSLREFGCEQSFLSRPDGSASFIQGNNTLNTIVSLHDVLFHIAMWLQTKSELSASWTHLKWKSLLSIKST